LRNKEFNLTGGGIGLGGGQNRLTGSLNWQTSDKEIEKHILEEFRLQLKGRLQGIEILIKSKLQDLIQEAIEYSSLYDALVNRNQPLYFELGAVESPEEIRNLIDVLRASVFVNKPNIRKLGNRINMSISVFAINTKYVDMAIAAGKYVSINKKGETTLIPWLEWLLKSPPFIKEWSVKFGGFDSSRTGGAIMIKTGHGWSLPVEFRGTEEDNFITRAVDDYEVADKMDKFIQKTLFTMLM
jgi:hypothetical protein